MPAGPLSNARKPAAAAGVAVAPVVASAPSAPEDGRREEEREADEAKPEPAAERSEGDGSGMGAAPSGGNEEEQRTGEQINAALLEALDNFCTCIDVGGSPARPGREPSEGVGVASIAHVTTSPGKPDAPKGGSGSAAAPPAQMPVEHVAHLSSTPAMAKSTSTPKIQHQTPGPVLTGCARGKGRVLRDDSPSLLPPPTFEVTKFLEQVLHSAQSTYLASPR